MKFGKKLERLLLAEMGVCLIVLLLSMSGRCSSMAILLSTLFQIFMIIYIIVVLVHPLQAYARILEHLNKTEFEREELRMAPAGVPFVKETYSLLDRYAAYKTRKNNAQILNKQTELTALQSQINPHFLYNTLSLINWKAIEADAEDISKITLALSTFYRTSLNKGKNVMSLSDELRNMRSYLDIQLMMHDYEFDVEFDVDESIGQYQSLNLMLQPLIENAIAHGIDVKTDGRGKLTITGKEDGDLIVLTVADNGVGMSDEQAARILTEESKGYGVRNVNERIKLYYGEQYSLQIESKIGQGTKASIRIPKRIS